MYAITSGDIAVIPLISAFASFRLAANERAPGSGYLHARPADGPCKTAIPHWGLGALVDCVNESIITYPKERLTPKQARKLVVISHAFIVQDGGPRVGQ